MEEGPIEFDEGVETAHSKYPVVPGLTDDYTAEELEAAWAYTIRLFRENSGNQEILVQQGAEPYLVIVPASLAVEKLFDWLICYFGELKSCLENGKLLPLRDVAALTNLPAERLKAFCDLYFKYICKVAPSNLAVRKNFALGLLHEVMRQPGDRNLKIFEGFDCSLTSENLAAFRALAAEQKEHDVKKYFALNQRATITPEKRAEHLLTVSLFFRQKSCFVEHVEKQKERSPQDTLYHPITIAAMALIDSINSLGNNVEPSNMNINFALVNNAAFLRDLGRLFDLNPKLSRPYLVPQNVAGEWENPFGLNKNHWDELKKACINADTEINVIHKAILSWNSQSPAPLKPKTWLGKMTYYIFGFDQIYSKIHVWSHGRFFGAGGLNAPPGIHAHMEAGYDLPIFVMLEYYATCFSYNSIKSGYFLNFWDKFFVDDPSGFTFPTFAVYYLNNSVLAANFQRFLRADKRNLARIIVFASSGSLSGQAFALKILADYCGSDAKKATTIAVQILASEDPYVKARLFAFVAHFDDPAPVIQAISNMHIDPKIADQPNTDKPPAKNPKITDQLFQSFPELEFPPRDLSAMCKHIIDNRSSHISHEGNVVRASVLSSPLKAEFEEIRITKNRETNKNPHGLACNVVLIKKSVPFYCRLTLEGNLILRSLNQNGVTLEEFDRGQAVQENKSDNKSLAFFDELNYFILEALAAVCVRNNGNVTDARPPDLPTAVPAATIADDGDIPAPGPAAIPGFPETATRTEGAMVVDLTDEERFLRKRKAKQDKIKIQTNLGRVREVFAPLARGQVLPESPPDELKSLLLHQCVVLDIPANDGKVYKNERVFEVVRDQSKIYEGLRNGEIKPEDVYVRTGRAFSQPLPYVQSLRTVTFPQDANSPDSSVIQKPYYAVRKKRIRAAAARLKRDTFMETEIAQEIVIGDMLKILHFDVPDSPENRAIFARIKSGLDIPGILQTVQREIKAALDEQRRIVRKKYLETKTPDMARYSRIMKKLGVLAEKKYTDAEQILKETAKKTIEIAEPIKTESGIVMHTKLRLPQAGFKFDQTFNQGRFKTLAAILGLKTG